MKENLIILSLIYVLINPLSIAFGEDGLEMFTIKDSVIKATTLNSIEILFVKSDNPDSYKHPSNGKPILLKYRDDMRIHGTAMFENISLRFMVKIESLSVNNKIYPMEGFLIDNDERCGIEPNITPIDEKQGLYKARLNVGLSCYAAIIKPIKISDIPK